MLLFGAGHETTVNLIGNGLLALHHTPTAAAPEDNPSLVAKRSRSCALRFLGMTGARAGRY